MLIIAVARWPTIVDAMRDLTSPAPVSVLQVPPAPTGFEPFFNLVSQDPDIVKRAESTIRAGWDDSHAVLLLEIQRVVPSPIVWSRIQNLLAWASGQSHADTDLYWHWIWSENPGVPPNYAEFKAAIYSTIDPLFREYFDDNPSATIRLDEIRWGGVKRDGIPPLDRPSRIEATDATFLDDDNVVFGVQFNDEAVAYPKRILAWHEMVKDTVGGESINGVYCTLCGSMIVYRTTADGVHYELGTSGFLYRSNKLMYDRATQSMWSTLKGEPVVGPLVGRGIRLEPLYVVTTTWGEWRRRHPTTTVLSLETGHSRDYSEGAAYRSYFSTDKVMFSVPRLDDRLQNKDEVLAIRLLEFPDEQLAISADYLIDHRLYHARVGSIDFVVLTDTSGANRVYETGGRQFVAWNDEDTVSEDGGTIWKVTESALIRDDGGERLRRLPAIVNHLVS